ncbi:MAG: AraC family transcriptional regulator [Pseudomonadota bacterium]
MNVLSEILEGLRAEGIVTGRFTLSAPWGFAKDAVNGANFRIAGGNGYWIAVKGGVPLRVEPGDLVFLPHGDRHAMMSSLDVPLIPFDDMVTASGVEPDIARPLAFSAGGGGAETDLYTGIVLFHERRRNPTLAMLPQLIHIRAAEINESSWFASTLKCFVEESMACQPGWNFAAARLADLLLLHVLRIYLRTNSGASPGWLRGLHDPHIGNALRLMHTEPQLPWTVTTLASAIAMSRSRFDTRFRELVGQSPIAYLTVRRMCLASEYLVGGKCRIADVADKVGYASEKSFTRAFRRWAGVPPRTYLKSCAPTSARLDPAQVE